MALGAKDVWASNQRGIVDPRPRVMASARTSFDRILGSGGVFVIFSEPILHQEHRLARASEYHGLYDDRPLEIDNWSFLSILDTDCLEKEQCSGNEVQEDKNSNAVSKLLAKYLSGARYCARLHPTYKLDKDSGGPIYFSIAQNKFGESVAGVIVMPDAKGTVFLLPHVANKSELIVEFVESLLPALHPHLYPFDEKNNWLHDPAYEHPAVLEMRLQQQQLMRQADLAVAAIEKDIDEERNRLSFLHGLLTGSGDALVADVATVLKTLGFKDVIDADSTLEETANKQEDLQVHDTSPVLLIEVKGLAGMPTESDTVQVIKYIPRRMKEWSRTDVDGVVVVNHQKSLPPANRNHEHVFTPQQIEDATNHDVLLVTTWELFKLARGQLQYNWPTEALLPLFYSKGRIAHVPCHWTEAGEVVHYYDEINVVSILLVTPLRKGCRVGFALKTGFVEMDVKELHVNKQSVPIANAGDRVGIKVSLVRKELPGRTRCYLVAPDLAGVAKCN